MSPHLILVCWEIGGHTIKDKRPHLKDGSDSLRKMRSELEDGKLSKYLAMSAREQQLT